MANSNVISPPASSHGSTTALARVADVVLDPVAAFRHADTQPTWGIAFLALVALRFGSVLAFYNPDTTPGKLLAAILFQLVTIFPLVAISAALLWVVALIWRARVTWASAWCVTTHVMFAYTLLTVAIASVAGALVPDTVEVELRRPPFTNLGFLVSASESPVWHALGTEADVRSLYAMALGWIGLRSAAGTTGWTSGGVVATCVATEVLVAVASAAAK